MVFSGIVHSKGRLMSTKATIGCKSTSEGVTLEIAHAIPVTPGAFYLGCSIAVNGVCLTVTSFTSFSFTADLAPETLRRTNLGFLVAEDEVNLELPLGVADRNSGHYVQGHVDAVVRVAACTPDGDSLRVEFSGIPEMLKFVVEKGYVALDGTSLTVCRASRTSFEIMLIPHTQAVIRKWKVGDLVNLEVDCMAKYLQAYSAQGDRLPLLLSFAAVALSGLSLYKSLRV
jgi:riboflavin synthase